MGHHGVFQKTIIHNAPQSVNQAVRHVGFERTPIPTDSEIYIGAVALVDVALNLNTDARRAWVDIICAWSKPAELLTSEVTGELGSYLQEVLSDTSKTDSKLLSRRYKKWEADFGWNPDSVKLKTMVNDFILKAYNGPTEPKPYRAMGIYTYQQRIPKRKITVTPGNVRPELKHAISYLSFFDHMGINPDDVDRNTMGSDYAIITSGEKPSTVDGRKRRPVINELLRNAHVTYKHYESIYHAAEKWYRAKVIRGSVTEVASEDQRERLTISVQITLFNHITGLTA